METTRVLLVLLFLTSLIKFYDIAALHNKVLGLKKMLTRSAVFSVVLTFITLTLFLRHASGQSFSCPDGRTDMMQYFAMARQRRANQFLEGNFNSIFTKVVPDRDFAESGYWFWLKSPKAHGFDVKAFDEERIYMRSTELEWKDNSTFKRFIRDLPISYRCVADDQPGGEIRVADTRFEFFSSCRQYKTSDLGTAVNTLDEPIKMDAGPELGRVSTRVLHYRYNCDRSYSHCKDEEQFFLAYGYGLWRWEHIKNGELKKDVLIDELKSGASAEIPACPESYLDN